MTCCALGPCDRSRQRGGEGCHLCDVTALLPQPMNHDERMEARAADLADKAERAAKATKAPATRPAPARRKKA